MATHRLPGPESHLLTLGTRCEFQIEGSNDYSGPTTFMLHQTTW